MTRIFLTGASGFIGGEALYQLAQLPGHLEIVALVRNASKADRIAKLFPDVKIVPGDLDDAAKIEEEARSCDIVLHLAATGHVASAKAIAKGLGDGRSGKPGYWIQMSGASLYSGKDISDGRYGEAPEKVYDDVSDIETIRQTISSSAKRVVDQLVLSQDPSRVKTALIPGPLIYGTGRGPGNTKSIQAPTIARYTLENGEGFRIGAGKSVWSNIHVQDLCRMIVGLVEMAVQDQEGMWNQDGIYHAERGRMSFGDLGQRIALESHTQGLIESPDNIRVISPEDASVVMPHAEVLLATNAVTQASRASQALTWKPEMPSLDDSIAEIVKIEAEDRDKAA